MIEGLKPYSEYNETGQEWLGQVPAHWSLLPNRAIFEEVKDRNHTGDEMLSVTITRGIVRQKSLLSDTSKKDSSNVNKSAYKLVQPGDIAYNKMRAWQGALGASLFRGIISPAYVVMRPKKKANAWFYHHLYRTPAFAKEAERWSYGITSDMWSLRPEHFKVIYTVLPPPDEQAAIVRFLDHANRKIDRFIRAKRKLIGLLNEQKQAIIHRAVTRGLNPDAPLKPSGIPWLGDIPKHWETIAVGAGTNLIQTGPFGSQLHSHEYIKGGTPIVNPSHMVDGQVIADAEVAVSETKARSLAKHRLTIGDIVAARRGELGRCALVENKEEGWLCGTGSLLLRCKHDVFRPGYFQEVFSSPGVCGLLRLSSIGATMDNLNAGMVARLRFPLPPIDEQDKILKFIIAEKKKIRDAISRTEREIALMQEYRTRLTADIVTGKLDVREAAAKLPDLPADTDLAEADAAEDEFLEEPESE